MREREKSDEMTPIEPAKPQHKQSSEIQPPVPKSWPNADRLEYDPQTVKSEFLNNFPHWMPGGYKRDMFGTSTFGEVMYEGMKPDPEYSLKFLNLTPQKFIDIVDAAIVEAGIDQNTIPKLHTIRACAFNSGEESELELQNFRVYEVLRRQGFYQQDLIV